jgi:hypothetical protein
VVNVATQDFADVHLDMGDMRSQIINALLFLQFTDSERVTNGW